LEESNGFNYQSPNIKYDLHKRSEKDSHKDDKGVFEKLEVTIIPVDEEPYNKTISIPYSLIGKNSYLFILLSNVHF